MQRLIETGYTNRQLLEVVLGVF